VEFWICRQATNGNNLQLELVNGDEESKLKNWVARLDAIAKGPPLIRDFWKLFCDYKKDSCISLLKMSSGRLGGNIKRLVRQAWKDKRADYVLFNIWGDMLNKLTRDGGKKKNVEILRSQFANPAHQDEFSTIFEMERLKIKPKKELEAEFRELMKLCV
jgi:hypothetical protein